MREWPSEVAFYTTNPPTEFDKPVEISWTNKDGSVSKLTGLILSVIKEPPRQTPEPLLNMVRVVLQSPEPQVTVS